MSQEEMHYQDVENRNRVLIELLADEIAARRESQVSQNGMRELYDKAWNTLYEIGDLVKDTTNSKTLRKDIIKVLDKFYRY
jgi:hypothetical protein